MTEQGFERRRTPRELEGILKAVEAVKNHHRQVWLERDEDGTQEELEMYVLIGVAEGLRFALGEKTGLDGLMAIGSERYIRDYDNLKAQDRTLFEKIR